MRFLQLLKQATSSSSTVPDNSKANENEEVEAIVVPDEPAAEVLATNSMVVNATGKEKRYILCHWSAI